MENKENIFKIVLKVILLVAFTILIIIGQKRIGYLGIGLMMLGLLGILGLLFLYNKSQS